MSGLFIALAIAGVFAVAACVDWTLDRMAMQRQTGVRPAPRHRDERGEVEDDALIAAAGVVVLVVFVVLAVMGA